MGQEKQAGIQVARAIAALGIVYFHSWVAITRFPQNTAYPIPGLSTHGWLSVDLFFAISGFVICLVVSRRAFDVKSFLIKRVFRLYPLWLLMLTVFAFTAWLWRGLQPRETLGFFLYSGTLLPTDGFPMYNVGWSLQHEMVFYLIAATVVPFFGIFGLVSILVVSSAAFHLIEMPWYLGDLARHHPEFLAGVVAFLVRNRASKFGFLLPFTAGTGMLVLFSANLYWNFVPLALLFLVLSFSNLDLTRDSLWSRSAVALGDSSYSVYLIHPMVFFAASAAVSKFYSAPLWAEEPIRWICIGFAIALALLSWRFFEKPLIRFGNEIASILPRSRAPTKAGTVIPYNRP